MTIFAVPLAGKSSETNKQNERKVINNKFDELAKGMAQSVTRRGALKKFGLGLAGMALACFGLVKTAEAGTCPTLCVCNNCKTFMPKKCPMYEECVTYCAGYCL